MKVKEETTRRLAARASVEPATAEVETKELIKRAGKFAKPFRVT